MHLQQPQHPIDPRESVARGAAFHEAGRLDEAAAIYRQILAHSPENFDAAHLLGVVALQQGRFREAQQLIRVAVGINPHDAGALGNLGLSYLRDGQIESAFRWLTVALKLEPNSISALFNAAGALRDLRRSREAIPLLERAYAEDPSSYIVCRLLGECLMECGMARRAVEAFDAATYSEPESAEAWTSLAAALTAVGEHERAHACAVRAEGLKPVATSPPTDQHPHPHAAVAAPSVTVLADVAYILLINGLHDEAIEQLEDALRIDPLNLSHRWTIAIARLKPVYVDSSDLLAARAAFTDSLAEIADWYERTPGIAAPYRSVGMIQPFYISYQAFNNRDLLRQHGSLCAAWMATLPAEILGALHAPKPEPFTQRESRKLRLGIVSTQIRSHSTWHAITKGWLENIDRTKFDVIVFQLNKDSDRETERARLAASCVEDRPNSVPDWIKAIRDAALDVLIYPSVAMDPLPLQLASLRLAPVQAAAWGHPETTGLPTIDLYLSGEAFEPAEATAHYTEKLVRLPNFGVYVEPLNPSSAEPDLSALGLPDDAPLLLCPGAPFKYSPVDDHVWVEIAKHLQKGVFRRRVGGRLVFFRSHVRALDRMLETRLRAAFTAAGLEFDAHVSYIEHLDRPRFFGLLRRSALMLDTLAFSGFNLGVQAMECGLPLLAYEGEFMRGRLASAIMRRLGLSELVATTKQEFVSKAVDLALNAKRRSDLRAAIIARREILFRDVAPIRALERELTQAVARASGTETV
jgi:predicted O-linked N-acetylglucosamine transferase (SPINDLY family)